VKSFRASVWQEGELYVAQCLDVDVASQGRSERDALKALEEALELHFTPPNASILPKLTTIKVRVDAA
jgi:predicted RNase H-like HicB family nuclease